MCGMHAITCNITFHSSAFECSDGKFRKFRKWTLLHSFNTNEHYWNVCKTSTIIRNHRMKSAQQCECNFCVSVHVSTISTCEKWTSIFEKKTWKKCVFHYRKYNSRRKTSRDQREKFTHIPTTHTRTNPIVSIANALPHAVAATQWMTSSVRKCICALWALCTSIELRQLHNLDTAAAVPRVWSTCVCVCVCVDRLCRRCVQICCAITNTIARTQFVRQCASFVSNAVHT